jgi:selenocysteine lyase/cysteine desulfurase
VTGIISDTSAISSLLHRHGALSFWDFAAAAPYVGIEMRSADGADYKDAIFISPHKFIGGPGTPGVLVVRKDLLTNRVPAVPGGGTVAYVNPEEHRYLTDPEHREEGGTPAIVESIRCGLVFKLKEEVGSETIRQREEYYIRRAIAAWSDEPNLDILGNHDAERLSIVSFVVRHGDRYLHHNYVVALLNDLFGIQARGGCSCAGPYGHRLLGIDLETSHRYEAEISKGCEVIKPGWVRVNFNYFIDDDEFDYIVEAVRLIARLGWALLPRYEFEVGTGTWRHAAGVPTPPLSLTDVSFLAGDGGRLPSTVGPESYPDYLVEADRILTDAAADPGSTDEQVLGDEVEALRWFRVGTEIG